MYADEITERTSHCGSCFVTGQVENVVVARFGFRERHEASRRCLSLEHGKLTQLGLNEACDAKTKLFCSEINGSRTAYGSVSKCVRNFEKAQCNSCVAIPMTSDI